MKKAVKFTYTNWQGQTRERTVVPILLYFGTADRHEGEQHFLRAFDLDADAERTFAMKDVSGWRPAQEATR